MKRNYITPALRVVRLAGEDAYCATSTLSADGGENTDITMSDEEYDGTFRSNRNGWDSADWTDQ